jgi:hypothetical protein
MDIIWIITAFPRTKNNPRMPDDGGQCAMSVAFRIGYNCLPKIGLLMECVQELRSATIAL